MKKIASVFLVLTIMFQMIFGFFDISIVSAEENKNNILSFRALAYYLYTYQYGTYVSTKEIGTIKYTVPSEWTKISDLLETEGVKNFDDSNYQLLFDKPYAYRDINVKPLEDWYVIYNEEKNQIYLNDKFVPNSTTSPNDGWPITNWYVMPAFYYKEPGPEPYDIIILDWNLGSSGDISVHGGYRRNVNTFAEPYDPYSNEYMQIKGWYYENGEKYDTFNTYISEDLYLKAEWYYTTKINFDANGGTGFIDSTVDVIDTTYVDRNTVRTITLPTIDNYTSPIDEETGEAATFKGWSTDPMGRSTIYPAGSTYNIPRSGEFTMYAIWSNTVATKIKIPAYIRNYYGNSTSYYDSYAGMVEVEVPDGWTKLKDLIEYVDRAKIHCPTTGFVNEYSYCNIYKKDDYRVLAVEALNSAIDIEKWYIRMNDELGVPYIFSDTSVTPNEDSLAGWYDSAYSWPYDQMRVLFEKKTTNRVTFIPNGGTFTDGTTTKKESYFGNGSAGVIPQFNVPENIIFVGWFDKEGNQYAENAISMVTDDITLTAKFAGDYNLVFDANGAINPEKLPEKLEKIQDNDIIILPNGNDLVGPIDPYSGKNATFVGWSENPLGNTGDKEIIKNKVYPAGSEYVIHSDNGSGNVTLYAIWTAYDYDHDEIYFSIRDNGELATDEPKSGHSESDTYTSILGSNGEVYSTATKVLKEKKLMVADFDALDNSAIMNNLIITPTDEEIKKAVPGYNPNTQYVFWYVIKLEDNIGDVSGWRVDGVIRNKKTYQLSFDTNTTDTVSNMPEASTVVHGLSIDSLLKNPTRDGYTFVGWTYNNELIDDSFEMPSENITLVASWEKIIEDIKAYQLSFDMNTTDTVSNMPESSIVEQGTSISSLLKAPTRDGYTFVGWIYNDKLIDDSFEMPNEDITLVASWEKVIKVPDTLAHDNSGILIAISMILLAVGALIIRKSLKRNK